MKKKSYILIVVISLIGGFFGGITANRLSLLNPGDKREGEKLKKVIGIAIYHTSDKTPSSPFHHIGSGSCPAEKVITGIRILFRVCPESTPYIKQPVSPLGVSA